MHRPCKSRPTADDGHCCRRGYFRGLRRWCAAFIVYALNTAARSFGRRARFVSMNKKAGKSPSGLVLGWDALWDDMAGKAHAQTVRGAGSGRFTRGSGPRGQHWSRGTLPGRRLGCGASAPRASTEFGLPPHLPLTPLKADPPQG